MPKKSKSTAEAVDSKKTVVASGKSKSGDQSLKPPKSVASAHKSIKSRTAPKNEKVGKASSKSESKNKKNETSKAAKMAKDHKKSTKTASKGKKDNQMSSMAAAKSKADHKKSSKTTSKGKKDVQSISTTASKPKTDREASSKATVKKDKQTNSIAASTQRTDRKASSKAASEGKKDMKLISMTASNLKTDREASLKATVKKDEQTNSIAASTQKTDRKASSKSASKGSKAIQTSTMVVSKQKPAPTDTKDQQSSSIVKSQPAYWKTSSKSELKDKKDVQTKSKIGYESMQSFENSKMGDQSCILATSIPSKCTSLRAAAKSLKDLEAHSRVASINKKDETSSIMGSKEDRKASSKEKESKREKGRKKYSKSESKRDEVSYVRSSTFKKNKRIIISVFIVLFIIVACVASIAVFFALQVYSVGHGSSSSGEIHPHSFMSSVSSTTTTPTTTTTVPDRKPDGTIHDAKYFNIDLEAKKLNEAIAKDPSGKYVYNDSTIIDVLCKHSNIQRLRIVETIQNKYNKDLREELRDLGKFFQKVCKALLTSPAEYDASEMIKDNRVNLKIFIEIMVTRTNEQIIAIRGAVERQTGNKTIASLLNESAAEDNFKRFGQTLCDATRDETKIPDKTKAKSQAKKLHDAGVGKWETESFNLILQYFGRESRTQLRLISKEYESLSQQSIEHAIGEAFKGEYIRRALLGTVECANDIDLYFAKRFNAAIGNDKATMMRIIITRSEVDLKNIKEAYQKQYHGKTMEAAVTGQTSEDKALAGIVRGNANEQ